MSSPAASSASSTSTVPVTTSAPGTSAAKPAQPKPTGTPTTTGAPGSTAGPKATADPKSTAGSQASPSAGTPAGKPASTTAVPPSSDSPAITTAVPPPTTGNIHQTVQTKAVTTAPKVPITGTASFKNKVDARITAINPISVQGQGPGEISGPGLEIVVTIDNGSSQEIDLSNTIVDLTDSEGEPAIAITSGGEPFTGVLAPGASATATYEFTVAEDRRDPVSIALSYTTDAPVVIFTGGAD